MPMHACTLQKHSNYIHVHIMIVVYLPQCINSRTPIACDICVLVRYSTVMRLQNTANAVKGASRRLVTADKE